MPRLLQAVSGLWRRVRARAHRSEHGPDVSLLLDEMAVLLSLLLGTGVDLFVCERKLGHSGPR